MGLDALDGAEAFERCLGPGRRQAVAGAGAARAERLQALGRETAPLLRPLAYAKVAGSVLQAVLDRVMQELLELSDISAEESEALPQLLAPLLRLYARSPLRSPSSRPPWGCSRRHCATWCTAGPQGFCPPWGSPPLRLPASSRPSSRIPPCGARASRQSRAWPSRPKKKKTSKNGCEKGGLHLGFFAFGAPPAPPP